MARSAHKPWFPYFKLSLFLVVFASIMYFTLEVFDPHFEPPVEQPKEKTTRQKQVEFIINLFQSKLKK